MRHFAALRQIAAGSSATFYRTKAAIPGTRLLASRRRALLQIQYDGDSGSDLIGHPGITLKRRYAPLRLSVSPRIPVLSQLRRFKPLLQLPPRKSQRRQHEQDYQETVHDRIHSVSSFLSFGFAGSNHDNQCQQAADTGADERFHLRLIGSLDLLNQLGKSPGDTAFRDEHASLWLGISDKIRVKLNAFERFIVRRTKSREMQHHIPFSIHNGDTTSTLAQMRRDIRHNDQGEVFLLAYT